MQEIFDSRNLENKTPFGAIKTDENTHFKIFLPKDMKCSSAKLYVKDEFRNKEHLYPLFLNEKFAQETEIWECDFRTKKCGIYWYKFLLETNIGIIFLFRDNFGKAKFDLDRKQNFYLPNWQLTVYKKNFIAPSWLCGGIMYQIMPDRFFRSNKIKKNIPKERILRTDWGGLPFWKSNSEKENITSDYFCGDLAGITEKLDYIKSLGVNAIYLNPIFEAHSNHRYNTADYTKIDPLLGTEDDFKNLCHQAKKLGINIILDGVFSHTGSDSIYFNKQNRYPLKGAYNTKDSEFFSWYQFYNWPQDYACWWGFDTLPNVNELNPRFANYITGKNGIIKKWLKLGASGWRLDVADELPDKFIKKVATSAKKIKTEPLILGEVWEDASNKISYGKRRKYLLGNELNSVMNYPFRKIILDFFEGKHANLVMNEILNILENYPKPIIDSLMNILSTHDTERILTVLGGEPILSRNRNWQAKQKLSQKEKDNAINLLKIAAALQYTLPGIPCIFYGDETALEGYKDPFCRKCFPWQEKNEDLISFFQALGKIRNNTKCLAYGEFLPIKAQGRFLGYLRQEEQNKMFCLFNLEDYDYFLELSAKNIRLSLGTAEKINSKIKIPPKNFALIEALEE